MKTLLRVLISLMIVLWVGAVLFFPAVANIAFQVLPDKATAGLLVRNCLTTLHTEGLVAGSILLILLLLAAWQRAYGRTLTGPILCTVAMLLLTALSQQNLIPHMEADRIAVGGDMDGVSPREPHRREFDRLHRASVEMEEGVLAAGVAMIVFLARPPKRDDDTAAAR